MAQFCPTCEQRIDKRQLHDCRPKTKPEVPSQDGGIGFFGCNMNPKSTDALPHEGPGYPNEDGGSTSTE